MLPCIQAFVIKKLYTLHKCNSYKYCFIRNRILCTLKNNHNYKKIQTYAQSLSNDYCYAISQI